MIRITKLADYAIIVLVQFVHGAAQRTWTATELATCTGLPVPTVTKVLKLATKGGVLQSQRGVNGGYRLARPSDQVSASDIIAAIEGPVAITECFSVPAGACDYEPRCPTQPAWRQINVAIRAALEGVSLQEMSCSVAERLAQLGASAPTTSPMEV